MSYRIVRMKVLGEIMYVITDADGDRISEWEDLDEARAELHDLNDYAEDVVDFMFRSTPGHSDERTNDEVLDEQA